MTVKMHPGIGYAALCGCLLIWATLHARGSSAEETLSESRQVILPMSIDYALLNALVRNTFLEGGAVAGMDSEKNRKTLYSGQEGCQSVIVSAPRFREEDGELLMETQVHLRSGRSLGQYCVLPLRFDGVLVMHQRPSVSPEDWTLRFTPIKSEMRTMEGQPARLASLAWRLVEEHVLGSLSDVSVNLDPPRQELQDFLPLMLTAGDRTGVLEMLQDLRPGDILIQPQGLRLENILVVFDELYQPEPERVGPYLSVEELERFVASWEVWDAFFVQIITTLTTRQLTNDEELLLLDVLLRMRHEFADHLEDPAGQNNLVRLQFMEAWTRLGPLFRAHLLEEENDSLLGYLAFFSASDALLALDKLGPTLGLEISRDGLIRLAWLMNDQEAFLEYGPELLPELRHTLGLSRKPDSELGHEENGRESPPDSPWSQSLNSLLRHTATLFIKTARGESPPSELKADLAHWIFQEQNLQGYMDRVIGLLRDRADVILDKAEKPPERPDFFHDLVLATAWQESCFRQFTISGGQITYIQSSNNTSVGIMQINERVWRGLYDQSRLRWDIAYNAQAGGEILDLYFTNYAQPRMGREPARDWPPELQAAMLYAMYNGGPGQMERFLIRFQEDALFRSDRLFQEKWDWVRRSAMDKISICLVGS